MILLAYLLAIFFAMNMGGGGISPSFAAPYGANIISSKRAALLFGVFVLLGAILAGGEVIKTLSQKIIPQEFITSKTTLIILFSATVSLFLGNLFRVPLSTSAVTVFSLVFTGLYFRKVFWQELFYLAIFWLTFPVISYFLTYVAGRLVFPLEKREFILRHPKILKIFVIFSGCYVAFSVGSNNVANAVAPLVGAKILDKSLGILIIAPFFGVGALIFGRGILNTIGKEITGIGILGAFVNGLVIGTLLLISSFLGVPEPLVQLDAASVMAIGSVNCGHRYLFEHDVIRKIVSLWILSPLVSGVITLLLLKLFV